MSVLSAWLRRAFAVDPERPQELKDSVPDDVRQASHAVSNATMAVRQSASRLSRETTANTDAMRALVQRMRGEQDVYNH